jgi:hypothetical protein
MTESAIMLAEEKDNSASEGRSPRKTGQTGRLTEH